MEMGTGTKTTVYIAIRKVSLLAIRMLCNIIQISNAG